MMKYFLSLFFFLFTFLHATAQTASLEGRITTAEGKPAEGVTLLLRPAGLETVADNAGTFRFTGLDSGQYTLVVSLIGYSDREEPVALQAGESKHLSIQLSLSERALNEVVVVANRSQFKTNRISSSLRLQSPILEIPQSIQVVTARLIQNQQIFDMLEGVTRNVSGAARVEHWDNYARIMVRGTNAGAFRNGMNISTQWGPLTEDMSMVERIEFVKGPAGFMLANGNPGGFYNVVTKKPSGRNRGEVGFSLGSFNLQRATLDLDGKLSGNGKLLYRLNLMGGLRGSHRPYDFNNRYTLAPVLKYLIDEKTDLTLELTQQYSEVNVIGSNYSFSKRGYADLPRSFTTAEPGLPKTVMNDRSLQLHFNHRFSDNWQLTAQGAYFNYQQEGASLWPTAFSADNDSLMQRGMSSWDVLGLTRVGQLFVNGNLRTGAVTHKLLGGVDLSDKDYYHDWNQGGNLGTAGFNIYAPVYGSGIIPQFDRSRSLRERGVRYYNAYQAVYLQDELGLFDNRLRLTLAGRYTRLGTGNVYSGDYASSRFTPRLGLSYSLDRNTSVYLLSDQSFTENYGADWQGRAFDPLTGENLEAGFKRDWMNGRWNSTVSVYRITRNNVLTADLDRPNPSGGYFNRQGGQHRTEGVEADLRGQIAEGLDVVLNYAYTDARVTKDSKEETIGVQLPGSARHLQNTWLNYRVQRGKLAGLGLSAGYQFQGKRSPWYVFDGTENSLPDYFRIDGGIGYQRDKIGFNLLVNNVLNRYLYSGAPYTWGGFYYWQAEPGRNLRFTLNYRF